MINNFNNLEEAYQVYKQIKDSGNLIPSGFFEKCKNVHRNNTGYYLTTNALQIRFRKRYKNKILKYNDYNHPESKGKFVGHNSDDIKDFSNNSTSNKDKNEYNSGSSIKFDQHEDGTATAESKDKRIKSLDDLIEACEINLDEWIIERHIVNKWEVGAKDALGDLIVEPLFQIKAWLKPHTTKIDLDKLRKEFIEDANNHAPHYKKITYPKSWSDSYMQEISIYDPHIGKLVMGDVGEVVYNSEIATNLYLEVFEKLLEKYINKPVKQILLPIGHDDIHIDNSKNTTTHGTPQYPDIFHNHLFTIIRQMYIKAIELASTIAPVVVKVIPGNHNEESAYMLGDSLKGWLSHNPNVTVDNTPDFTKFHLFGKNLFMLNHGKDIKLDRLPMMMPIWAKDYWSNADFYEVHIGHGHQQKGYIPVEDTKQSIMVRMIPSLSPADVWHMKHAFDGSNRAAQSFLYSSNEGLTDYSQINISRVKKSFVF